jgi:sulfate/thiosulfate transport system permease protein
MGEAGLRKPVGAEWALYAGVLVALAALLVVPLGALVVKVLAEPAEVVSTLGSEEALRALALTIGVAVVCIAVNGAFGVARAIVLVRQRFVGRRVLDALVDLPLALSSVMTGLAFLLLFGRTGWLRPALEAGGVDVAFAWPSVLVATLFVTLPFTLREVALVLAEIGDTEEQAAATWGATAWQTFVRVTLPNVRGGLVVGSTLTAACALGDFGAVLVVGGAIANRTQTATTFIHGALEERQDAAAHGMALLLAGAAVALLFILQQRRR